MLTSMPQRKSPRLKDFDYGSTGAYFVTVCTYDRKCLFGTCVEGKVELSTVGRQVEEEWVRSGDIRSEIRLDEFIVMPNHLHGIVWITRPSNPSTRTSTYARSIGSLMSGFKSACTKRYRQSAGEGAVLWQRRFYDHVIRDESSLTKIREYVRFNPLKWEDDPENPAAKPQRTPPSEPWG